MKILAMFFCFLLSVVCQTYGQVTTYENYLDNKSFFNQLSPDLTNHKAHTFLIRTITEVRYQLDTNENVSDTLTLHKYFFDQLGQVVEKQFGFSKDRKKYTSHKYIYSNDNSSIDTLIVDTRKPMLLLDGVYGQEVSSDCKRYGRGRRLEEIEVEFYSGEFSFLHIQLYYNKYQLLSEVAVDTDKGSYIHEMHYEFYEKYKH